MNKPTAIVYTSNTGFTKRYAEMLGGLLNLKVYELKHSKNLPSGADIIYMGWLCAGNIKGYAKAVRRFNILSVVCVALGDAAQEEAVRKSINLPESTPLFFAQGGMNYEKLKGVNRLLITMLSKGLSSKQNLTDDEKRMLEAINKGGDFADEKNLDAVINWYNQYDR